MKSPAVQTAGYFLIFFIPALFALGWYLGHHYLLGAFFFGILPFSRVVFGAAPDRASEYSELQASLLYHLPGCYVAVVVPFVASLPFALTSAHLTSQSLVAFTFSLLVLFAMASCVSHALIHQPPWHRRLGSVLSAVCAYPWMQYEHLPHHARSRATELASSPRLTESGLAFALRRLYLVPLMSFRFRHSGAGSHAVKNLLDDLYTHLTISALTWLLFTVVVGVAGFWIYLACLVLTPMIISLVNYIQHWGLGQDATSVLPSARHAAWDDDCQVLTWLTLDLNFHYNHHRNPSSAFFHRSGKFLGPRMPISYGFAVLLCLVPPVWRRVMQPTLDKWIANPAAIQSAGNRLFCFSTPSKDELTTAP